MTSQARNTYSTDTIVQSNGDTVHRTLFNWATFSIDGMAEEYTKLCDEGRALADNVAAIPEPSFADLVLAFEDLFVRMQRLIGPMGHLAAVTPNRYPGIEKLEEKIGVIDAAYRTDIGQHVPLFDAFKRFRASSAYEQLSAEEKKIIDDSIRDFTLGGVALPAKEKARLKEINEESSLVGEKFKQNVKDYQEAWSHHVTDRSELDGVPGPVLADMENSAKEKGLSGWLVTVKQNVAAGVLDYAKNRELRRLVHRAWSTRASDQGPRAGEFDNTPVIQKLLALAHEKALILGFANHAERVLPKRMMPSVDAVTEFLADLSVRTHKRAHDEWDKMREFARLELGIDELEGWDHAFVATLLQEKLYGFDPEEVRKYFPVSKVMEGLFGVMHDLYDGLTARRRDDIKAYRDDVHFYEILDADGNFKGGVWVDLFARSDKRPGAWMDIAEYRRVSDSGTFAPIAYLTCNFTPPENAREEAYLNFGDEVITTFHEFGHDLHHLLSATRYCDSGMMGVEWDAVELPSQLMEEFARDPRAMQAMSAHKETGEMIPLDLAERVIAAEKFNAALMLTRQLVFGTFDWELYRDYDPINPPDLAAKWEETHRRIAATPYYSWQRSACSFGHIFAGGYSAGYYSYLNAMVLVADARGAFVETGELRNPVVGRKLRSEILEKGSSAPMRALYRNFRGRDADPLALLRYYGLLS